MTPESGAGPDEPRTDGRAMLLPLLRDDALAGDVRLAVEAIEAEVRDELRRAVEGLEATLTDVKKSVIWMVGFAHGRAGHAQDPLTCDDPLCGSSRLIEAHIDEALLSEKGAE